MALLLANAGADPNIEACLDYGTSRSPLYEQLVVWPLERGAGLEVGEEPRSIPGLHAGIPDVLEDHVRKLEAKS